MQADRERGAGVSRRACAGVLATLLLAACSDGPRRPNVVIVSIDTLRADHLGCYGYGRDTSPAIDALARQGAVFENAWSVTSWTLPSHVTMLTGLPISAHAQCDWDLEATESVASHLPRGRSVAEAMARSGYDTAGFYSCPYLEPKFGFGAGFETWQRAYHSVHSEPGLAERWEAARKARDADTMRRIHDENPHLFDAEARSTPVAVDGALRWLDGRAGDDDPFLLFVHVYDVHSPYTPPAPFDTRFDPDYTGSIDGREVGDVDSPVHAGMDPRDLQHVIALYDGEIAAVDRDLARLFEALERHGAPEDTLVIVTSDHGEEFFEHGAKQHGGNLYRETLQVPLIVKWPGRVPPGTRSSATVGLVDLVPSLRAATGLEPDELLPGVDLVELAKRAGPPAERQLVAELTIRRGVDEPIWMSSLIDGREHTIVRRAGVDGWSAERFDLIRDPRERAPAQGIDAASPDAAELLARLEAARAELRRLREAAPEHREAGSVVHAAERVQLEALGYGGEAPGKPFGVDRLCFDGCIWRP